MKQIIAFFLLALCPALLHSSAGAETQNKKTRLIFNVSTDVSLCDRIRGMLWASAIADAMGGPHEGRSTKVSQQFLQDGHWLDRFDAYTPWFQHHWNCYQSHAPAGTFTDDNRMRLAMAKFMIDHGKTSDRPMSRKELAAAVFAQYRRAVNDFNDWDRKYKQADTKADSEKINVTRKEKFLALWFGYELMKTASSVYVPDNPPVATPPYKRVNETNPKSEYDTHWHLQAQAAVPITGDVKYQYHWNTYEKGLEMPLGLIHLLPAAAWFPGQPRDAFAYIMQNDFFDIKNAPYYPATTVALLAELLGGRPWASLSDQVLADGVEGLTAVARDSVIDFIDDGMRRAIRTARRFHAMPAKNKREQAIPFIVELHKLFAQDGICMCTPPEMLFVTTALLEFAQDDLNFLIELGVNYGRDNDTVGSIAATLGGAALGDSGLNRQWMHTVGEANAGYDINGAGSALCKIARKSAR